MQWSNILKNIKRLKGEIKMGYCSEVAITMHKTDFDTLVRQAYKKSTDALDLIRCAYLYEKDVNNSVTMYWDWTKWNEYFNSVGFIMSFIRDNNIQYQLKRVGESSGDIEEEINDDDFKLGEEAYVVCTINTSCAGDEVNTDLFIDEILQKPEQTSEENVEDNIEEVSEKELLNIINT